MPDESVEEIPAYAKSEGAWIDGVVWRPEIVAVSCVHVIHTQIDATMLQVHVHIGIDEWIVTHLYASEGLVLHGKLSHGRGIVGGIVRGEIAHVAT